jgi:hypothetical protein
MATLVANAAGEVSGKFTIPAGIQAGTKAVRAVGAAGSAGVTSFTGRGTIRTEERRRVTTITETAQSSDPLAQTFTMEAPRHIAGVDLWFAVAGANDVLVQIRDTLAGVPGSSVLAEKRIKPSEIIGSGQHTRILFDAPVWLDAGREYALVALTDSATAALHVAELGKFDATAQKWITGQAYQVGVLLSSSNASTWTAHQDKDLTFRLLAARFTATSRTIPLGVANVADCSDLLAEMTIDIPATGTNAQLLATAPSGEVFRMAPDKPVALPSRINGNVALSMLLEGNAVASPVLYPGMQFVAGDLEQSGTYVTRAFPAGTSARISVTFEAYVPGTATVTVEIQKQDGSWQTLTLTGGVDVGDGWVERSYILAGFTATQTRVRLTLTGTAAARPRVRKLRAVATD